MRRLSFLCVLLAVTLLASFSTADPVLDRLSQDSATPPVFHTQEGHTTPTLVSGLDLSLPGRDPAARANAFVDRYRDLFLPGDAQSEVRVRRTVGSLYGQAVQMDQLLDGTRVFGSSFILSHDNLQRVRMVVNDLKPLTHPTLSADLVAREVAVDGVLTAFEQSGGTARDEPRVETVWWPSGQHLTKVHLVTVPGGNPFADLTFLVGGPGGTILYVFEHTPLAQGYAYYSSPLHGAHELVDLPHLTSAEHLTGENVTVYNCMGALSNQCTPQQAAQPDLNGDYLIEPTGDDEPKLSTDKFVEVQAYYAVNFIHNFIDQIGPPPPPIEIWVNIDAGYGAMPNASYGQSKIMIGQVPNVIDLALENDVVMHEYGHHVFDVHASTGMFDIDEYGITFIGLSFNEATADYWACAALDDPALGEYWASEQPQYFMNDYLRNIDNQLHCPEGLFGESHDDGLVWSGFLWEVRGLIGKEQADPLYLDVLDNFPQSIDFPTATQIYLARAALALDATTVEQIRAIAEERGLTDCERFIPITEDGHLGYSMGRANLDMIPGLKDQVPLLPVELHYFIEVPDNAGTLELYWNPPVYYVKADVVLMVREDQRVTHDIVMNPWNFQWMSNYDFLVEEPGVFDLRNPDPDTPFLPGHTYYIHPCNQSDPNGVYKMRGKTSLADMDGGTDGGVDGGTDGGADSGPDGGAGDDGGVIECPDGWDWTPNGCIPVCKSGYKPKQEGDQWTCVPDDSGCGCRTNAAGAGLWLLAGLALFLRRRK